MEKIVIGERKKSPMEFELLYSTYDRPNFIARLRNDSCRLDNTMTTFACSLFSFSY
jgi:hypothetical protein